MKNKDADDIATLAGWWVASSYRVVLTGAGMSTESGLPDFRSPQGLWRGGQDPRKLASISALHSNTTEFYEFYRMRLANLHKAEPHKGHFALAQLQRERLLDAIITQNVDGLHHRAGAARVIELHGNLREAKCIECGRVYPSRIMEEQDLPRCSHCQGLLKPGVILFGEGLPGEALRQAEMETRRAHIFVVIGSSLEVSPANYFPVLARERGAKLAFINLEPTHMDEDAHLIIKGRAGEVLTELLEKVHEINNNGPR